MVRRRAAIAPACLLVSLLVAALATPVPVRAAARIAQKASRKLGCELLDKRPSGAVCVTMTVEAWYHMAASDLNAAPLTGTPTFSPYPEKTLHIGASAGKEDSRTYLVLDVTDLPFGATITGGKLVLALDEENSTTPQDAGMQACYVAKPPEKSVEGSFDTPPKPDCSISSKATYRKKPRPYFVVDLAAFVSTLTSAAGGIALMPTEKTSEESASWHVSLYAKKNATKQAVAIAALLEFVTVDIDTPGITGINGSPGGADSGSSFQPVDTGSAGFPLGGSLDMGEPTTSDSSEPPQPVAAGSDLAAQPTMSLAPRYTGVWYLPVALLVGAVFVGHLLTRKIEAS